MSQLHYLRDADFAPNGVPLVKTSKPILVPVLSSTCPHCKAVIGTLQELARDQRFLVLPILTSNTVIASNMLRVTQSPGVPTFLLFRDGRFRGKFDGPRDVKSLAAFTLSSI